jgi:hypothetical protein
MSFVEEGHDPICGKLQSSSLFRRPPEHSESQPPSRVMTQTVLLSGDSPARRWREVKTSRTGLLRILVLATVLYIPHIYPRHIHSRRLFTSAND